jgi:dipeptidyl aminopeptidase/acylaminoacyl peptidase
MRRFISPFAFFFAAVLALESTPAVIAAPAAAAVAPRPITYADYDAWKAIREMNISDDGTHLAYSLVPTTGDAILVIRDNTTGKELREERGVAPRFTADGKFVVYTRNASLKEINAAHFAPKPADAAPKGGIGVVELATGNVVTFDRVKSVQVARDGGGRFIAFLNEPAPHASARPRASENGATPEESPSPTPAPKADKKKDDGSDLVVRDLASGTNTTIPNVTEYALSDDDRTLAYATQTKSGAGDGVHILDLAANTTHDALVGNGRYKELAISRNGSALGFLSDVRTYAQDVPHYDAYVVDLHAAQPVAVIAVDETNRGLPHAQLPNENGTISFARDGSRMFLGTAAAPTPFPSGTPLPIAVDLWTYKDAQLQSQQAHDAANERKHTYLGVYDLATKRFAQLASPSLRTVETNRNPNVALGLDGRAYEIASSWSGQDANDLYAVSLFDGSRTLLGRKLAAARLSPGGAYVVAWDDHLRHWISLRTRDGKRTVLAPNAKVTFYDETDDHPGPPPPYGLGGWIAGDRGIIVYDRYEPWLVDLATGVARNLTHGVGRATGVSYSVLNTDADRDALPAHEPFLLSLSDQHTYASGFATVAYGGGTPHTLLHIDKTIDNAGGALGNPYHTRVAPPIKARHAERLVFTEESYRNFRDYWISDKTFANPQKATNANPQLANYRWGSEQLISYPGPGGKTLHAVLLLPDGFDPHKKYPMLVYFYEQWSYMFHTFYAPTPGYPTISRYVSNGYAVLLPDVVYKVGHPGQSALQCIGAAIDAVEKRGFVDSKHIGIAGHSWAAYQINYMITQTDRFRAVEAGAAVANMTSAYGGIRLESGRVREGQYEAGQSRIGATPWERPDLYLENSGLFHIQNIHTPYLTMHNDADDAVPYSQGVEFMTAMRRLHKVAYMFTFNGKPHNLRYTSPADLDDIKYWAVAFDEWFDYWLKGAPRPAWFDGVDYLHKGERNIHPSYGEDYTGTPVSQ